MAHAVGCRNGMAISDGVMKFAKQVLPLLNLKKITNVFTSFIGFKWNDGLNLHEFLSKFGFWWYKT